MEDGAVIAPRDGEVLHLRGPSRSGEVVIKVAPPEGGTLPFAMGTQRLDPGKRIPVHRHAEQDEILFIHRGTGTAVLDEAHHPVEAGSTVSIPRGVWHGVENTGSAPLDLVWFISPPGLEGMFREIGAPPGAPAAALHDAEFRDVVRRHRMEVREDGAPSASAELADS